MFASKNPENARNARGSDAKGRKLQSRNNPSDKAKIGVNGKDAKPANGSPSPYHASRTNTKAAITSSPPPLPARPVHDEHDWHAEQRQLVRWGQSPPNIRYQAGTPPPAYTALPGQLQSMSTTNLPDRSNRSTMLGSIQSGTVPSESIGMDGSLLTERLELDRMARDMDATIAAIDDLTSAETQLGRAPANDLSPLPSRSQTNIRAVQHSRSQSFPQPLSYLAKNYYAKVWLYSNSRLPPHLPPFKVYMPTYPLLCLAARYSLHSYKHPTTPSAKNLTASIPPSLRHGTKATLLLLHPDDTSNTIVLAVRGTHSFSDWAVNLSSAPASPEGFLADPGNLAHSGFLYVARSMLTPCAAALRQLIADNPARKSAHLLLTGHSAGGAVAALLYAHLTSPDIPSDPPTPPVTSELKSLRGFLGRVHCVTFGAPPCTLLPLQRPSSHRRDDDPWRKSLFFAFLNEGDPVVRAGDAAYPRALLRLYRAPSPSSAVPFPVPDSPFSNAGRLVLLRVAQTNPPPPPPKQKKSLGRVLRLSKPGASSTARPRSEEKIQAFAVTDAQLRPVVFGDPRAHAMKLYAERVERLAVDAVTSGLDVR